MTNLLWLLFSLLPLTSSNAAVVLFLTGVFFFKEAVEAKRRTKQKKKLFCWEATQEKIEKSGLGAL